MSILGLHAADIDFTDSALAKDRRAVVVLKGKLNANGPQSLERPTHKPSNEAT